MDRFFFLFPLIHLLLYFSPSFPYCLLPASPSHFLQAPIAATMATTSLPSYGVGGIVSHTHAHTLCVGSFFARVIEALNPSVIYFFVVVKTKAGKAQRKLSPPLLNGV